MISQLPSDGVKSDPVDLMIRRFGFAVTISKVNNHYTATACCLLLYSELRCRAIISNVTL